MTDLDHYLRTHQGAWARLAELTERIERKPASLSATEVEEFLALHRRVASQLSFVRGRFDEPRITSHLNHLAADAHASLHQRRSSPVTAVRAFFSVAFPAAVWHLRRFVVVAVLITFVPTALTALWLTSSNQALDTMAPEADRAAYVNEDFESYYSSAPAEEFATNVLVNNIQVSFLAFGLGAFLAVGTVYILAFNGLNLGVAWAIFITAGQQGKFWGLILPHGLLELSAVVIAGGAGLALGWAVIDPGDRSRAAAFAEQGRRSVAIIIGLMLVFITAAIIEAFVTPSGLPTSMRVTVGVLVELLFVTYVVALGRQAEVAGLTGGLDERRARPEPSQSRPMALASR